MKTPREFYILEDKTFEKIPEEEKNHYFGDVFTAPGKNRIHVREVASEEKMVYTAQDAGKRIALKTQLDRKTRALEKAKEILRAFGDGTFGGLMKIELKTIESLERGE